MAPFSAKQLSVFLALLSLFFTSHARESQLFSKFSRTDPNRRPLEQEKKPEREYHPTFYNSEEVNPTGLYGQAPPTTTASETKPAPWRPWNYREDSYVTEAEKDSAGPTDRDQSPPLTTTDDTVSRPYTSKSTHEQPEKYRQSSYEPTYGKAQSNFGNDDDQRYSEKSEVLAATNYNDDNYAHVGSRDTTTYEPQGMSDTRTFRGGKFNYDLNAGRFSEKHPYNKFNSMNGYQNQVDDVEDTNMP